MLNRDHQLAEQERYQEMIRKAAHERLVIEATAGRPSLIAKVWTWINGQLAAKPAGTSHKTETITAIRTAKQT